MATEILFREFIAIAQASDSSSPSTSGQGYNYWVHISAPLPINAEREHELRSGFKEVLKQIDHSFLGLDKDLGFKPTTLALGQWLAGKLQEKGATSVSLERGDGVSLLISHNHSPRGP